MTKRELRSREVIEKKRAPKSIGCDRTDINPHKTLTQKGQTHRALHIRQADTK